MIFASSLGAVVHMVGLLCIQAPYLIYILIIRPLDGRQHNIVECINEIFFTLSAMFLVFYNTETAWSRGLEVTFINYLLANSIIIALISLTGLIICLVRRAIKKLRSPKSNRIAATPIQTTESLSPEPELQPQQIPTTPTNRVSSTLVSRLKPAEKNNSNEESKHTKMNNGKYQLKQMFSWSKNLKNGPWTNEEHLQFIKCLKIHGIDWPKLKEMIPTRTRHQIKSHQRRYFYQIKKHFGLDDPMEYILNNKCDNLRFYKNGRTENEVNKV